MGYSVLGKGNVLGNINLNLLRSLHILLEEHHVSRTAERLHISQSAVSRQLAQLRELCQDPLLIREGTKLIPTAKALAMKSKLDSLISEFDSILEDVPLNLATIKESLFLLLATM